MLSPFVGCENIATLAHRDAVRRGHPLHQGKSRMPESGLSGSVRGVPSNGHPYRDPGPKPDQLLSWEESSGLLSMSPETNRLTGSLPQDNQWRGSGPERP